MEDSPRKAAGGGKKRVLTDTKVMRQVFLINLDSSPAPLMLRRIFPRSMLLPPYDEFIPSLVRNPMVILSKEDVELGHVSPVRDSLVTNLPELVGPSLLRDHGHFIHTKVQCLMHPVAAGQKPHRGCGSMGVHPQHPRRDEPQQGLRQQGRHPVRYERSIGPDHRDPPQQVELHALGGLCEVGDGGKEQDPRPQVQVRVQARVVHVPVEELQRQVRAQGMAHEHDVVEGLARPGPPGRDGVCGGQVLGAGLQLVLYVVGRVGARVEGGVMVCVVEAC